MAFQTYQPNYYYPMQYPTQANGIPPQANGIPPQMNTAQQPIQNGGYVVVQSEDEIRHYPVAHGNLVTFRIENQPIVVEKSMGYSQFDTPRYKRYKLIEEDMPIPEETKVEYALKSDFDTLATDLKGQIDALRGEFEGIKEHPEKKTATRKKEAES